MGLHGASWGFMGLHGASWDIMGYHVISWDCFVLFLFFWCPKKIFGGTRKIKSIRDPELSSPIPSLTKIYGGPMKKKPFKDLGLSSPIPFLTKIYGGPMKKTLSKTQGSPAQSIPSPKNFWRSHEKKPFQRPRALQPNPFPHQKIFGGPRKTKLFKRHSLTKNFWRSHEKNPFKDPGLSSPIPSLTKKIFGGPRKTKLLKRPRAFQPNPFPHQKSQGFPAQSIPSPIPSHAIFASHFFCVVSRSKIPQAFAAELPKEATYSSLLTVPLLFF